jgi:hypothetical protein
VALHETWVDHAVVGGGCSHATVALLHDDSENKTSIDAGGVGHGLDATGDVVHLVVGVVGNIPLGTRVGHDSLVGLEPGIKH